MKVVFLAGVKVILTLCLFALALRSVDISDVWLHIKRLPTSSLLSVVALFVCQMAVTAIRLTAISEIIKCSVPFVKAFRINWVGAFFSQALVTFVSGDVVRAMMLRRSSAMTARESVGTVTLDRAVGLLSSLLILSVTAPWAIQLTGNEKMRQSIELLAIMGVLLITGFAVIGYLARHPELVEIARAKIRGSRIAYLLLDVFSVSRYLFSGRRKTPVIMLTSLAIQLANVAIIFLLINGMGAEVSFWECVLIVPSVMLISLLPFSIAGWGLRESAMATGFVLVHAPAAAALAASVVYGMLTLLVALPGGLLWSSGAKIPSATSPS